MYHFGIPGIFVWITHILMGIFLVYIGYKVLNNKPISQINSLVLIILGVLAILYHLHLWYDNNKDLFFNHKVITTFNGNKYDLTDWVKKHPGGAKNILKTNNKDLTNVWKNNNVLWHLNNEKVMKTLESYKIN